MEEEKSKSRKQSLGVLTKDRRDRDRDRRGCSKERKKGKSSEKDCRRRRYERIKSIDSEFECDHTLLKREKRKEENKDRRRRERDRDRERERKKRSDSEEEDERYKRRANEKETRHREHDREGEKERKRERSREESDVDDIKRDLKRRRKESGEKSVGSSSRHVDDNGDESETLDGQKQLDEKMEKRRRRVQEWQELKRQKEEAESESNCWSFERESDDEQGPPQQEQSENESEDDEVIDPVDAYMNTFVFPEVEKLRNSAPPLTANDGDQPKKGINKALGRSIQGEDSDSDSDYTEPTSDDDDPSLDKDDEEFMPRIKKTKAEKISLIDHSQIKYEPFRKNFYTEVKDISKMTQEEVNAYRKELELKVHGKDVPRPIKSWHQTGLTNRVLDTIKKLNYEKPMPIQAQALPIIMSGRDCIGVAKTGSGKTLGFVLPMLRHIKDQPPVESGDGPIGLVMAPTRELVQQIHKDIKKFAKALGIRCVAVYGGSGVAQQISELKRGAEIVVCTPGRMIDVLCTNSGKVTNLGRVTFLVMDEADRMFDLGFEPQITRIIQNIRPDRQTVLFSATFPRQIETLARKVLNKPVEIQAGGGSSVVNKDITQLVEIIPESERKSRLVDLIGDWYEKGKILVFVRTQEKCDGLYNDLKNKCGYCCRSLHGGMDQKYRESAISDFKSNVCNLLIATSVAARGLDVKELELVVNFDAPNHYEDYVHRVGRTGRAGRKGCAVTLISEDDAKYAPDLVKALVLSEQPVPDDLKAIADGFVAKVNQGIEKAHGSGYGGSGFKFTEEEEEVRKEAEKAQAKQYGFEEDKSSDSEDESDDVVRKVTAGNNLLPNGVNPVTVPGFASIQQKIAKIQAEAMPERYGAELEINDYPQNARWKVTHKETLGRISEWAGAAITTRGQFYAAGRVPGRGERKLYLFIEGPNEKSVRAARDELKRVLKDITNQVLSVPGRSQPGKYSVL